MKILTNKERENLSNQVFYKIHKAVIATYEKFGKSDNGVMPDKFEELLKITLNHYNDLKVYMPETYVDCVLEPTDFDSLRNII